ncbi:MAG: lysylphosphatidylglycerol synthase transmembrane domain-containing protein, partial [Thermoplasmata archaeon]
AFPGRIGDFARAYYIRTHENVPISAGFASLFLEKVYDVAVMVLISVFLFLFVIDKTLLPKDMFTGLVIVILFISFIVFCLILMMAFPNFGKKLSNITGKTIDCTIGKILPKIGSRLKSKLEGFIEMLINSTVQISKDKRCLILSTIMTVLIWVLEAERATCILISFGMKSDLSLIIFVFTFGTLIGLILPILPGNLGVLEFVLSTLIFVMLAISKETAWAIVLVDRFVSFWFITILGGLAIFLLSRTKSKEVNFQNENALKDKVIVKSAK